MVGTAGPALEGSGFGCFLEAARLVLNSGRDCEFLIARQGDAALDLRRHAQSLGIADRVSVVDFAALGPRIWTVLDLYCQPSLVPSTGRTMALALARSIPSIASRVKVLDTLIDDGTTGLLVPPDQPEALAAAITRMFDDPDQALAMGRHAQEMREADSTWTWRPTSWPRSTGGTRLQPPSRRCGAGMIPAVSAGPHGHSRRVALGAGLRSQDLPCTGMPERRSEPVSGFTHVQGVPSTSCRKSR